MLSIMWWFSMKGPQSYKIETKVATWYDNSRCSPTPRFPRFLGEVLFGGNLECFVLGYSDWTWIMNGSAYIASISHLSQIGWWQIMFLYVVVKWSTDFLLNAVYLATASFFQVVLSSLPSMHYFVVVNLWSCPLFIFFYHSRLQFPYYFYFLRVMMVNLCKAPISRASWF